jgi:non-homologous end joining protein Ku
MKAISSASLNLGVLNAPIKIYSAASDKSDIRFKLCDESGQEVEQVYRVKGTDTIVGTRNECGKSYNGHVIDKNAIKDAEEESVIDTVNGTEVDLKKGMHIESFISVKDIPFERVTGHYLIGPDQKQTDTAFATIVGAMKKTKSAAVAKHVLKGRQSLFVMYVEKDEASGADVLHAVKLCYADTLNAAGEEVTEYTKPDKAYVDQAVKLIEAYTDPEAKVLVEAKDSLVEKKRALVDKVAAGEAVKVTNIDSKRKDAPDVMDAITAEIERAKKTKTKVA